MVLLKNDSNTLPINRTTVKKIARHRRDGDVTAAGDEQSGSAPTRRPGCSTDFTTNVRTGDSGSSRVFSDPGKSVGPLAGITAGRERRLVTATAAPRRDAGRRFRFRGRDCGPDGR